MPSNRPASNPVIQERIFLACAAIFIASLVACNLIFQKFFFWDLPTPIGSYRFEISVGILPYPITFLVTDIISELYGKRRADLIVVSGFIASLFVIGLILVALAVPQTAWSPVSDETFRKVFGLATPAVLASMLAYLIAQFIDIRLFHFWKRLTKGKHLWLRNNGSTIVSQFVDTMTVLLVLCLAGVIEWDRFAKLLENGFLFKVLIALFDTPVIYLSIWFLRRLMGLKPGEEIPSQQSLV